MAILLAITSITSDTTDTQPLGIGLDQSSHLSSPRQYCPDTSRVEMGITVGPINVSGRTANRERMNEHSEG